MHCRRGMRCPAVGVLLVGACLLLSVVIGMLYAAPRGDLAVQDRQPVAFSHVLHAGQLSINCLYCHRSVDQSPAAGIPSMQLCMSCHSNLAEESDEARKVKTYWEERQPIAWVRLQRLPDHVYFPHDHHLRSGVDCRTCHGRVETMDHTPRAPSLEMGWCLSCHRARHASIDCWTCHK